MKRLGYLYQNLCNIDNIMESYEQIKKNTRNKRKIVNYEAFKCANIASIYRVLINKQYVVGSYNKFMIKEPKARLIMSMNMNDKIINHLVCNQILKPALFPCLIEENVSTRENKGTKLGLDLYYSYRNTCKNKYGVYYILKCDITKYFYSVDHDILKEKLRKKIKDIDALIILDKIIDSIDEGLPIGNMTSQYFAVFFLNDLDHFIKEKLKIKYYVRYQDDFILMHESKEYLKECLKQITEFLTKEKLTLNKKTRLYKSTDNITFLGRKVNGGYANYRRIKRKIKKRMYLYQEGLISLNSVIASKISYQYLNQRYKISADYDKKK